MPNLVERRKMKKQQFFATPSQIYNIYYTESVPVQQLPGLAQDLTKSFPQISLAASSISRGNKTPRSNGLFRRNRNTPRENKVTNSLPYFPEEYHRRQIANLAMNQLKIRAPEFCKNQNYQAENPQHENSVTEYPKNALNNYETSVDLPINIQERYKQFQGYRSDLQNMRRSRNSPQESPTSVSSSLDSCNRGMLNNSGQIITVPTQPMSSSQGYSMKIEVLAQPLKSEIKNSETPEEGSGNLYETAEFIRQKSVGPSQNVIAESKCVVPVREVPVQSTNSAIPCIKKKKRISFFTNIMQRIRRERVCQTSKMSSGQNLPPKVFKDAVNMPSSSDPGHLTSEEHSTNSSPTSENSTSDAKESNGNELYAAQEILSPRQMISSTTNMCSVKTDVRTTELAESDKKEASLQSKEVVNVMPSFQDVMEKLEDSLARYRFESDAQRKLFTSMITNQLKQHGIKLNIHDQFVAEILEDERRNKSNQNDTTMVEESGEKETAIFTKSQTPSRVNFHKKYTDQNTPVALNVTSRSHVFQINAAMDQLEDQIFLSSPNTKCKSAASSVSHVCESCRSRNPTSLFGQDEDRSSLKRESIRKGINILKDIEDDPYDSKALYEHDMVRNSYLLFEANPDNMVSVHEDDRIKYQRWLKMQSRDCQSSGQDYAEGGISSRHVKSNSFSENLENSANHDFLPHRCRQREHSPPERDLSSRLFLENNRGYNASANPSISGYDHVYFDPDTETRRYPPTADLACRGLVMYGQNESALSLAQSHHCHKTIPVCGTLSQGVSPRYESKFMLPSYHEREPCYLQCNRHREKTQCSHHVHRTVEKRRRHHHHHISKFEAKEEVKVKEEEEDEESKVCTPKETTDAVFSPSPMLRNLARAANTVLTTIFGRSASLTQNQEPHDKEPKSQDPVVISKTKRPTNCAMRRQTCEEQVKGCAVFNSHGN